MPTDILTLQLSTFIPAQLRPGLALRPLEAADQDALAALYLASYPPGVAAADLAEAHQEMQASFAGDFGELRLDASASAWHEGSPVGAIMVVGHSIWDEGLQGPFIIDLFVSPDARGLGAGRALVAHAVAACAAAADPQISLRFGPGTSEAALAIYDQLGFRPCRTD